jgi:hypothetical protein
MWIFIFSNKTIPDVFPQMIDLPLPTVQIVRPMYKLVKVVQSLHQKELFWLVACG